MRFNATFSELTYVEFPVSCPHEQKTNNTVEMNAKLNFNFLKA